VPSDFDALFDDDARTESGVLEVLPGGWGFLRRNGFGPGSRDIYVAQALINGAGLKTGDTITGPVRPPRETERHRALVRVRSINQ
jgi:transcription termination factor Rho